jgi:hypothetical protein
MGLMPRRIVPFFLLLGTLGLWAGQGVSALPPPPAVTVPTVTVPPLPPAPVPVPVPLPPPPAVSVPPKAEAPPLPATPPPPVDLAVPVPAPVPLPQAAESSPLPELRGGDASSAYYRARTRMKRRSPSSSRKRQAAVSAAERKTAAPVARVSQVKGVAVAVQGPLPEDEGFLSGALGTLDDPGRAIPGALLAMAALAVFLFGLASMPPPVRTSWPGAVLVHKRASIASAGSAALVMAVATYLLL